MTTAVKKKPPQLLDLGINRNYINNLIPVLTTSTKTDLPGIHFLMSSANIMLSGQAHVYLGENLLILGAARHRNSQRPLLTLHQLIPGRTFRVQNNLALDGD